MCSWYKYFLYLCLCLGLFSCGGGSVNGSSNDNTSSLTFNAPYQYPAGIATTAYLTILNSSQSTVSNLTYDVPDLTNYTGTSISVDGDSASACKNIAAGASCVLKVQIGANSKPGSFSVVATSLSINGLASKLENMLGLNSQNFILKANIGLTNIPDNTQSGANGISFLYSPNISLSSSGSTLVSVVAVVNQNAGSNFNTIELTTYNGSPLDFKVLSGNSGNNLTNLSPGSIVTFQLSIPNGASSPYNFYAKTLENGTLVSQANIANPITLINSTQGILSVQPTQFSLSANSNYNTQVITYSNIGNQTINGLNITNPQSPLSIEQNNCSSDLGAGKSCTIKVFSSAASGSTGSGSIIASYSGGNQVVSSYSYSGGGNSQNGLSVSAINNFIFSATTSSGNSSTKLTIKNTGSVDESNFILSFAPNQYFSISQEGGDTCTVSSGTVTNVLSPNSSCTATLSYSNSILGAGLTTMNIHYSYSGNTADLTQALAWQTTSGGATLGVSPVSYNFGPIVANNNESKTQSFVITNQGPDSVNSINFGTLTGDSSYFSIESGGVGGCASAVPLANGSTCSFKVKFGPTGSISELISAILPINYAFSGGSSSTSVALSGYSRSALSANIQLTSVVSSASNGNGESVNSAFQFESSGALSSTITLTYQNSGKTSANNFIIAQSPSGYTIKTNNCNGVVLNANSGNSCTVILSPSVSTVGNMNIQLTSSVLYGSWTDENGAVNNQPILWSTLNGTQNMIYANIYQAPTVRAVLSSESSGSSTITQVNTNSIFYVVLSLTGGYNVNTTYSVTLPNGFTPSSASCIISSLNPQCYVEVTSPSAALSGATISLSGGSIVTTPSSLSINVVDSPSSIQYAYMSTGATGIFQCEMLESGGFTNCTKKGNPNAAPGTIVSLSMYPTNEYLYTLTNTGTLPTDIGSYYACPLGNTGYYESSSCVQKSFPAYGNLAFAPTQGSMYAYLVGSPRNSAGNSPNYCTIIGESSLFCNTRSSYPTQYANTVGSMVINGSSYVYIAGSSSDSSIYSCNVTDAAGYISPNCPNAAPLSRSMLVSTMSTIQIGNIYYAYVIDNSGGATLKACQIESSGVNKGKFANTNSGDCNSADPNSLVTSLDSATRISTSMINGKPYLYAFGNYTGSIDICPISTDPADGGAIIGYFDPIQGNYCANFILGTSPYISTPVSSMVFGSFSGT